MADTPISIFISYSRTNKDFVDRLEKDLRERGFRPWVDRGWLKGGDMWLDEIQKAIDSCHILLVVLSPEAVTSRYVKIEYRHALRLNKLVIPLHHKACTKEVPMDLHDLHWVDFLENYDRGFKDLLSALNHHTVKVNGPAAKPIAPVVPVHSTSTRHDFDDDADAPGPPSTPMPVVMPEDIPSATQAIPTQRNTAPDVDDPPVIELRSRRSRPTLPLPQREPDPVPSRPLRTSRQLPPAALVAGGAAAGAVAASVAAPARNPASGRRIPTTGVGMSTVAPRPSRAGGQPPRSTPPRRGGGGGLQRPARRRGWLLAGLIILLLALLLCSGLVFAQPTNPISRSIRGALGLPPSGTVSITPDSRPVSDTYTLTSANTTDPAARTVAMRTVDDTAQSTPVQVNATGHNGTAATQAHGTLTFFNAVAAAQQVNAGTTFPVGGGVTLVTDEIAFIPAANFPTTGQKTAANFPTTGQKTVAAHAEPAGRVGNIGALVLNGVGCCGTGIVVSNNAAFTGGTDAANYSFLKQNDVTSAVTQQTLDTTKQNALSNLSKQLHTGEQLFGATQCNPVISADQPIGDNGAAQPVSNANATYRMKCTSTAYDYAGARAVVSALLAQKAATTLPPVSNIQVSLTNSATANGKTSFFFSAKGLWVYQFSDQQKQNLAKSIAGKTVAEAEAILGSTPGVGKATITIGSGNRLPSDPNQLSIQVQSLTGPGSGPTPATAPTSLPQSQPTITEPVLQGGVGAGK